MKPTQVISVLEKTIPSKLPSLIVGPPGIGKSDIISQVCDKLKAKLIIEHPVVSDPTDYKGLPFASKGKATFLPFGNLEEIINAKELTVYFLDDLGQASPMVQAACMQLLLARRINGHKVSDNVCFVAATNRHKDGAAVSGILEPVKSRFVTIINLEVNTDDWVYWALQNNIPTELIAFIRFRPRLLFQFESSKEIKNSPSPRTIHNLAKIMMMGIDKDVEYEVFSGTVGEGFAAEFISFLRIYRNLPDIDGIILDPQKAKVPDDPSTQYAIAVALAKKAKEDNMDSIVTYSKRLPKEISVMLMKDAQRTNPSIINTRAWIEWASEMSATII